MQTLSLRRSRRRGFHPLPSSPPHPDRLSAAALTPDHVSTNPPCKRRCPRDRLAAPSWLLILSAHSVVACPLRAWDEPGGAPAEPASKAVTRLCPQPSGAWSPATRAVKGAGPTRPRPHASELRHSGVFKAGDTSRCVLKCERVRTSSTFVDRFSEGPGVLCRVAPTRRR